MECDHYAIPGYQECVEQAAERVRREIRHLQALHRGDHCDLPPAELNTKRLESMLAWRHTLLFALTPDIPAD
ncbi:hypothetical protein [Endothiovibrio diazotrophicus]